MAEFNKNSFATVQFNLRWKSSHGNHEEHYLARKINFWRDIVPESLKSNLAGKKIGDTVSLNFESGSELAQYDKGKVKDFPFKNFRLKFPDNKAQLPRKGRFYPQGVLSGIAGVYPQTAIPFRVLAAENYHFIADLNHPLSGTPFNLETKILNIADKDNETGGRLSHWIEEICNWGPGMQAPLKNSPTAFIHDDFFKRVDTEADNIFYSSPRLTGHIDAQASRNLRQTYTQHLKPGMRVLDLMSSLQSHLPENMNLDVTGIGMNMDELKMNPALNTHIIKDLNEDTSLDIGPASYDAIVCSLSIEYLTDPLNVLRQAYSALSKDGVLLLGLSNRWFPTKVTQGWLEMHEFERMGYLLQLAEQAGFKGKKGTVSIRNDWRPVTDKHFIATRGISDPIYVVWCKKS